MDLLIVGASVRAAAHSALRAGYHPVAVDRFGDHDLQSCCPTRQANSYPQGLLQESRKLESMAWMYTGSLENFPTVIDAMATHKRLLGNRGEVVRAVRDPWRVAAALGLHQFRVPELRREYLPLESRQWVRKPFRSGGGNGIRLVPANDFVTPRRRGRPTHYFQQFIPGQPLGAVFVAADRQAVLLGVTAQLVGCEWAGTDQFHYVGSIGPLSLPNVRQKHLEEIGGCLAEQFRLSGLFGIDLIHSDDELWAIEVNPRYTASVEILERACDFHAVHLHEKACTRFELPTSRPADAKKLFGKSTVYTRNQFQVSHAFANWMANQNANRDWPQVADIPRIGSNIEAGHPICTVFEEGETIPVVESRLRDLAAQVHRLAAR